MSQFVTEQATLGAGIVENVPPSVANVSSSPDATANISMPQLVGQLSSMVGGSQVGFLLEMLLNLLGLEMSTVLRFAPYVGVVVTLYSLWQYWASARAINFVLRNFTASVAIEGRDQLYNVVMAEWRRQNKKGTRPRYLRRAFATSERHYREGVFIDDEDESDSGSDDGGDDEGDDGQAGRTNKSGEYVMVNGRPNLATQVSRVFFTPKAGTFWLMGNYGPGPGTPFRIMMIRDLQPKQGIYLYTQDSEGPAYKMFLYAPFWHGGDLQEFLQKCLRDHNKKNSRKHLTILRSNNGRDGSHHWVRDRKKTPHRPESSVCVTPEVSEQFLGDMHKFVMQRQRLKERGMITRRGYLLYGEPGTGKTTLIQTAATVFGLTVYVVSMIGFRGTAIDMNNLLDEMVKPALLVFEDLDVAKVKTRPNLDAAAAAAAARDAGAGGGDGGHKMTQQQVNTVMAAQTPSEGDSNVLDILLQALDGVGAAQDRIVVITTNHEETLDPALVRPGRIDVKVRCGLATDAMAEKMFLRFFGPMSPPVGGGGDKADDGEPDKKEKEKGKKPEMAPYELGPELGADEAAQLAGEFGKILGGEVLSAADIENYCVTIFSDPREGVKNAPQWKEKTLKENADLRAKRAAAAAQKRALLQAAGQAR